MFVATLLPSWFVIVPTFASMWRAVFGPAPRRVPQSPPAHGPMQPAYG